MRKQKYDKKKSQQQIDSTYAHLQPQAPEIEKAVLGALMIDHDAYSKVCETLSPESFYEPRHQMVYAAIRDLAAENKPVEVLTVTERLAKNGTLEEVGGPGYVAELSSMVSSSANIEYHANIIAQKSLARQLISFTSVIQTKAFDETTDYDDLIQEIDSGLFKLVQRNIKRDDVSISVALKESHDKMMRAYANKGEMTGVPSGFYGLDEITGGWQNSDFIIIAGRPAMGKTTFALCCLLHAAMNKRIPSAIFSLEMSGVQLADRLSSNVCDIEGDKIRKGQLSDLDLVKYDKYIQRLYDSPITIDDSFSLSISELRIKARRLVREKGVKLIVIDYLQLMNANGMQCFSRQEEVSTISRSLKGLAKELNIPIIAISQLNRGVESREGLEGKRPQLSDLRESGAIEQDADMVLFVHRPEYYHIYQDDNGRDLHGMAQIIIAKHRKGATGDVLLTFRGEFTRFENPEDNALGRKPLLDSQDVKTIYEPQEVLDDEVPLPF